jgi:hypothetical protein
MRDSLRTKIQSFFDGRLKHTFPDPNFVFDVYVSPPHEQVWLVDVNPWAGRTDPLVFSWLEILKMKGPDVESRASRYRTEEQKEKKETAGSSEEESDDEQDADDEDDIPFVPEFRLIERDDPEAYGFNTPQFSAHKLPREVVDASQSGGAGMKEFMGQWQDVLARKIQIQEDEDAGVGV